MKVAASLHFGPNRYVTQQQSRLYLVSGIALALLDLIEMFQIRQM